jgi:hypothetical protein
MLLSRRRSPGAAEIGGSSLAACHKDPAAVGLWDGFLSGGVSVVERPYEITQCGLGPMWSWRGY